MCKSVLRPGRSKEEHWWLQRAKSQWLSRGLATNAVGGNTLRSQLKVYAIFLGLQLSQGILGW